MANKVIEIGIKINGLDTVKSQIDEALKKLEEPIDINISDEAVDKLKKINKATDEIGKTSKKTGTSIGDIAKGFGLMKIGEAILGKLADLFMENATVARAMDIATRALSIVFKDFFNFIADNIGNVVQGFKDFGQSVIDTFSNPKKLIEEFGTLIKENIEERINSTIDLFGYLASAVKKVFSGDFAGAMEDAKKAGKEFIDTQTGINNSFDKSVNGVKAVGEALGKAYDKTKKYLGGVVDLATAQIDTEAASKLAAAAARGRIKDLETEAEQLRQVRDNTQLSVADRIKANNKLKGKLEELRQAKLAETASDILSARNAVALNATTENKIALTDALNKVNEVNSDITGQLSEQEQNRSNLAKEAIALNQTAIDGIAKRAQAEKDFSVNQIKDITDRLDAEKQALIEGQKIEEDALIQKRNSYKIGTQERADADQAILDSQQKLKFDLVTNEKDKNLQLQAEQQQHLTATVENDQLSFQTRFEALDQELALINAKQFESEEAHTAAVKENTDRRNALRQTEIEVQNSYLNAAAGVADGLASISKEGGDIQKGFAISSAIISTYTAIAGQLAAFSGIPIPGFAIAQAIATGIFGLLQVKKIVETKPGASKSASSSTPSTASTALTPQVNLFGQGNNANTAINQTTEVKQGGDIVVKAYVSETEISNTQAFVSKANESAKL